MIFSIPANIRIGLIQNEEPEVVQLVEGLVRENISKKCLILVVIPMSGRLTSNLLYSRLTSTMSR